LFHRLPFHLVDIVKRQVDGASNGTINRELTAIVRTGIPEGVAMQMTGHKIRYIFERYSIVDKGDFAEAAAKLETFSAQPIAKDRVLGVGLKP
jgi:hypothetical protein